MKKPLIAIFILLFCGQVLGATYYIDPDCATPGDGTTQTCEASGPDTGDNAFDEFSDAGTQVAGNSYLFKGGATYTGKLTLSGQGTQANPIITSSYGTGRAIIDATGETQGIVSNGKAWHHVSNFDVIGNPTNGCIALRTNITTSAHGLKISNSSCSGTAGSCFAISHQLEAGDFPALVTDAVVDNVTADSCGLHGVGITGPYSGAIVTNSTVSNFSTVSSGWGIYVAGDSIKFKSTDNAFSQSGQDWTADAGDGLRATVDIVSVIYESVTLGTHWLTEDAALDDDYDWTHNPATPSITIRLPAGATPNTGCGCSTIVNYSIQPTGTIFEENTCTEARDEDGVCIGADHGAINTTIRRNTIKGTEGPGISYHANEGGTAHNNVISQCGETVSNGCVRASSIKSTATVNFYNNTIDATGSTYGAEGGGETGSNVTFINNIIDGTPTTGIAVATTGYGTVTASYNDNTGTTAMGAGVTDGGNNITGNPLLNLDYSLQPGSSAVDAGSNLGSPYNIDFNGRNQNGCGSGWDIGAMAYCNDGYLNDSIRDLVVPLVKGMLRQ